MAILNEALIPKEFIREKVTYAPDKKGYHGSDGRRR